MLGRPKINMIGVVKGKLTVVAEAASFPKDSGWLCVCECGNQIRVRGHHLRYSPTVSCGCVRRELVENLTYRHGCARKGKNTPEFRAWCSAKARCYETNNEKYPSYGGRGIRMADEWVNDFAAFLAHIGPKPSPKLSLDRIDVDGNYEPGNVRWATAHEQRINQRRMKKAA